MSTLSGSYRRVLDQGGPAGPRHFSCKFLYKVALATCWHAFRLRRLAQSDCPRSGLKLGLGIFPVNFRLKWLLWNIELHFNSFPFFPFFLQLFSISFQFLPFFLQFFSILSIFSYNSFQFFPSLLSIPKNNPKIEEYEKNCQKRSEELPKTCENWRKRIEIEFLLLYTTSGF